MELMLIIIGIFIFSILVYKTKGLAIVLLIWGCEFLDPKEMMYNGLNESNIEKIEKALNQGVDVNQISFNEKAQNFTPLTFAINNRSNIRTLKFLLNNNANINKYDGASLTPLFYAVKHNSSEAIDLLLSKGAKIDVGDNHGRTPLFWSKNLKTFQKLENQGAILSYKIKSNYFNDKNRADLLMYMAHKDRLDIVKYLIANKGFSPFTKDNIGINSTRYAPKGSKTRKYLEGLKKSKELEAKKIARGSTSGFNISKDYENSYYTYTTDTYTETSYYGNISETRLRGGNKVSNVTGATIKATVQNPYKFHNVRIILGISFNTSDYNSSPGDNCNTLFEGTSFYKEVILNINANSKGYFEKWIDTSVKGKGTGFCFHLSGTGEHGTYINGSSLKITVKKVTKI